MQYQPGGRGEAATSPKLGRSDDSPPDHNHEPSSAGQGANGLDVDTAPGTEVQKEHQSGPLDAPQVLVAADAQHMSSDHFDAELNRLFRRYDVDSSGTINSIEELTQLTLNLAVHIDLMMSPEVIDDAVHHHEVLSDSNAMGITEYRQWFLQAAAGKLVLG